MAEKVMLALVDEGMHRDEAHEALRTASMTSLEKGVNLLETCKADPSITNLIDGDDLVALFDPNSHLGVSGELVDAAVQRARSLL